MLKQIGKLITEPLRKGDKSRPLRWRMGMRLNHIHNDLHSKHPKLWNAIVMTARTLICKPLGHRWIRRVFVLRCLARGDYPERTNAFLSSVHGWRGAADEEFAC